MLLNTRGIVFQKVNYAESSLIVKIYTEQFGIRSYLIRGVKRQKSSFKPAYFQPLTILDLVVSNKENKSLQNVREVKAAYAYRSVFSDPRKQSVLFFLNEVLLKSIREEVPDRQFFEWLLNALKWFDMTDRSIVNYHLTFLFQLSRFAGFFPKITGVNPLYFDLQEGIFQDEHPEHPAYVSGPLVNYLVQLRNIRFEDSQELRISNTERRELLHILINYYQMHLPAFGQLKSLEVLENILR